MFLGFRNGAANSKKKPPMRSTRNAITNQSTHLVKQRYSTMLCSSLRHCVAYRCLIVTVYAARRCPIAVVLCGPRMPDRGGAMQPTHDPRQLHDVGGRERGYATPKAPPFLNTP
ncbi:hypothetical protein Y032_0242g3418 [Ancylostoma ceylanicum]|uniref:Uncharacterized protein n=1 Tax=Ancylostoma ceylanicum TaxID=53326 RepID=A0A016SEB1_9BILA|nr:hypothetical protein Y032_0242g3418 [Ancylostoma ceylanicum]